MQATLVLTNDLNRLYKSQATVKITMQHDGNMKITMDSKVHSDISVITLRKNLTDCLVKAKIEHEGFNIKVQSGRLNKKIEIVVNCDKYTVRQTNVNRVVNNKVVNTESTGLRSHFEKYGVDVTDWKTNSTKGLLEIYGVPKSKADLAVSLVKDWDSRINVTRTVSINQAKDGNTVNIRVKKEA